MSMHTLEIRYVKALKELEELEAEFVKYKKAIEKESTAYRNHVKVLEAQLAEAHSGQAYQAGKQDGIEAAAKESENQITGYASPAYNNACREVAECIRALKESDT